MSTFLFIVVCIVWFVVMFGIAAGGVLLTIRAVFEGDYGVAAAAVAGTILAIAFGIWLALTTGIIASDDNAEHCGPGTTYRESSRYDPATKTVRTDWVCEANR